jgi:hypothetical protein
MYKLAPLFSDFNTPIGIQRGVYRIADNAFIPFDPANADYVEYLKWVEAGNTPLPADEVGNG